MLPERHCAKQGLLVSGRDHVGEVEDAWWGPPCPEFGCGNLRCGKCKATVRQGVGVRVGKTAPEAVWAGLAGTGAVLDGNKQFRTYACKCDLMAVDASGPAENVDPSSHDDRSTPWRCAGHGRVVEEPEVDAWLKKPEPWSRQNPGWYAAIRIERLADPTAADAKLLASVEADAEPARTAATWAIAYRPHAAAFFALVDHALDHPERFDRPDGAIPSKKAWWPIALGARVRLGHDVAPELVAALRAWAQTPPGIDFLLFNLLVIDRAWCVDHADEIMDADPTAWGVLLRATRYESDDARRVVEAVAKRIPAPKLREMLVPLDGTPAARWILAKLGP